MAVNWLLDGEIFGDERDGLIAAIKSHGQHVKVVNPPKPGYSWDDEGCSYRETFPTDSCVIVHGDIDLATRVRRESRWVPGAYCNVERLKCSAYYTALGEFLLAREYIMVPFGDLLRQRDFLFATLGKDDQLFVRPDSPLKLFSGQLVGFDTFEADVEFLGFYEFDTAEIVVVSRPQTIECEWRFVVADKQVIAGATYGRDSKEALQAQVGDPAWEYVAQVTSSGYEPDPVWIADICSTPDGELRLLEINAFSYGQLYSIDKSPIVEAVSRRAWKDYRKATNQTADS